MTTQHQTDTSELNFISDVVIIDIVKTHCDV